MVLCLTRMPPWGQIAQAPRFTNPWAHRQARGRFGYPQSLVLFALYFDLSPPWSAKILWRCLNMLTFLFASDPRHNCIDFAIKSFSTVCPDTAWAELNFGTSNNQRQRVIKASLESIFIAVPIYAL